LVFRFVGEKSISGTGCAAASVHLGELADHLVRFVNARFRLVARAWVRGQPFELGVNAVLERTPAAFSARADALSFGFKNAL